MSRSRIDDEGYAVAQVVAWKPTLDTISRGVGFGLLGAIAAWISPLALITFVLQESWSDQAAWTFAIVVGSLTTSFYLVFMAGRRKLVIWKDGMRSKSPIASIPYLEPRDYWSEYDHSFNSIQEVLRTHQRLCEEMRRAGLNPDEASVKFLRNSS